MPSLSRDSSRIWRRVLCFQGSSKRCFYKTCIFSDILRKRQEMTSPKCPRCGGEDFHLKEQHQYQDSKYLSEENKNTYKRQLRCLKCNFDFVPST